MEGIRRKSYNNKSKNRGGCRALCCTNCRTSTTEESCESSRFASVSSISHIMVQQRLDQLIKQSEEHNNHATRLMETRKNNQKKAVNFATDYSNSSNINNSSSSSSSSSSNNKSNNSNNNNKKSNNSGNRRMVMMLAMEKSSEDPREDFRRSMVEVILGNKIKETKDLRYLLKCYISMNSVEYRGIILEIFYQVCNDIFFCCKCH